MDCQLPSEAQLTWEVNMSIYWTYSLFSNQPTRCLPVSIYLKLYTSISAPPPTESRKSSQSVNPVRVCSQMVGLFFSPPPQQNSLFIPLPDLKFIGMTDAEGEAPILWPTDVKSQLIRKDLDARKDWGQEEKGMADDEMAGWHHWISGHGFEQPPRDSEGQGKLACCSPQGHKELDISEWLNNNPDQRRCKLL